MRILGLILINTAIITLILGFSIFKEKKYFFAIPVLCAIYLLLDYNKGWLTQTIVSNVSFLSNLIPFFLYLNLGAGLVAAYFLIRDYMDEIKPPIVGEGEFSSRNMIAMVSLLVVGGTTIWLQKHFETPTNMETIATTQTENIKIISADNTSSLVNTLSYNEYGKYSFDLPALRFYSIMFHFIRGGNNVTLTDTTPPPDEEEYIENMENGTFVIDKVNSEFKYVTCEFKKEEIYKLKYSIKKKKWILLNQHDLLDKIIEIESY